MQNWLLLLSLLFTVIFLCYECCCCGFFPVLYAKALALPRSAVQRADHVKAMASFCIRNCKQQTEQFCMNITAMMTFWETRIGEIIQLNHKSDIVGQSNSTHKNVHLSPSFQPSLVKKPWVMVCGFEFLINLKRIAWSHGKVRRFHRSVCVHNTDWGDRGTCWRSFLRGSARFTHDSCIF